jgi:hypothetical protein
MLETLWSVLALFCIINCVGLAFLYWKMPETDWISLADTEQYFTSAVGHSTYLETMDGPVWQLLMLRI